MSPLHLRCLMMTRDGHRALCRPSYGRPCMAPLVPCWSITHSPQLADQLAGLHTLLGSSFSCGTSIRAGGSAGLAPPLPASLQSESLSCLLIGVVICLERWRQTGRAPAQIGAQWEKDPGAMQRPVIGPASWGSEMEPGWPLCTKND